MADILFTKDNTKKSKKDKLRKELKTTTEATITKKQDAKLLHLIAIDLGYLPKTFVVED
jgi:hypothetical protein